MTDRTYKIFIVFGLFLILASGAAFTLFSPKTLSELEVIFFDVGQGDAIFIKTPFGQNILIDGGPDNKVINQLSKALPFWERKIDLMILTHPHNDHIFGQNAVLDRYKVDRIIFTGIIHNSPSYLYWLEKVKEKNVPLTIVSYPQTFILGRDLKLEILYPFISLAGQETTDLNDTSIVARLLYGQTSFLFMGDAGRLVENKLLEASVAGDNHANQKNKKINLQSDVLKVSHHGSGESTQEVFLEAVKPNLAVISVGQNNYFNHPNKRVLNRLRKMGIKIYRTDLHKTIKIYSDGSNISFLQK